jgi:hypothetical protein
LDPDLKNKKETEEIKFDLRSRPSNKISLERNEEIDESKKKKKCC